MIDRKFRERAARAMFPSLSTRSPIWEDFVVKGDEASGGAVVRVAQAMSDLADELLAELAASRAEADTLLPPPAPIPKVPWRPERGDSVRVKGGRYAGARARVDAVGNTHASVTTFPGGMFRSEESHTFSLSDLEPVEA